MSHFHGTRHFKGGIELDENTMPPNSKYWKECATGALWKLQDLIGDEEARAQTDKITGTWKEICIQIEQLVNERKIK